MTRQELVDRYKAVQVVHKDFIARSADFPNIEEMSAHTSAYIRCQSKALLYETFRLRQPFVHVGFKVDAAKLDLLHVVALGYNQVGNLKLVPYSQNAFCAVNVADFKRTSFCNDGCDGWISCLVNRKFSYVKMKLGRKDTYICRFFPELAPELGITSKPFEKQVIVPYWHVRTTADRALANMHFVPLKVSLSIYAEMEDLLNVVTIPTE